MKVNIVDDKHRRSFTDNNMDSDDYDLLVKFIIMIKRYNEGKF